MTPIHVWRNSFNALGFAFLIIRAFLSVVRSIAGGVEFQMLCPSSGCTPNPIWTVTASLPPSGLTLIIAGILVLWMVSVESKREDRKSP